MADQNAQAGAQDKATDPDQDTQNAFASFETEAFENGERIETPAAPKKPETPPAEKKKEGEPGGAKDDEHVDEDEEGRTDDEGDAEGDADKPRKPKSAQDRIGELTRKRRDAERTADAERRRAEAAEARLAELEGSAPKKDEEQPPAAAAAKPAKGKDGKELKEPKADDYEFGELDSKYVRDLARYETAIAWAELEENSRQERQQEQKKEQQTAAQRKAAEKWDGIVKTGAEKYEDFQAVVVEGAQHEEWALSPEMGALLLESEVGADIAYHLASNPEESMEIVRMTPLEQARYFGKLEGKFSATQAAAKKDDEEPAQPKTPKAPPPPDRPRGRGGQIQATGSTQDFAAFERVAMEKM
jgi:hypothetical protein